MSCCEYLLISYSVVVDHPIFECVLWCKVVDVNLKMIDFDIKVENKSDNGSYQIEYKHTFEYVLLKQSRSDFIEHLSYPRSHGNL